MKTIQALALGCGIFASQASLAESVKVLGEGKVSADPDYVRVDLTVYSKCYSDVGDARNATNIAMRRIVELFETIVDEASEIDAVYTPGGSTNRSFGYYLPGSNQRVCVGTFEKSAAVTLFTSKVDEFEENFATIEDLAFSDELTQVSEVIDQPATYAELATPTALLAQETLNVLKQNALSLALEDAKAKFKVLTDGLCAVSSYRIDSVVEPEASRDAPLPYADFRERAFEGASAGEPAPIAFADIDVKKSLEVKFTYDEALCVVDKSRALTH